MTPPEKERDPEALDEWKECRATIARFDGILADTRKYGFTLVTVLLTANALVVSSNNTVDRPAASIIVMALLFALFMLDNYYWDLVRGAVGRAIELEKQNDEKVSIKITGKISERVAQSHATVLILIVYSVFVLVAMGTGLTAGPGSTPATPWGQYLVVLVAAGELLTMAAVFLIVQPDAPTARVFLKTPFGKRVKSLLRIPDNPDEDPVKVDGKSKAGEPKS
jgi:hypothetical protein